MVKRDDLQEQLTQMYLFWLKISFYTCMQVSMIETYFILYYFARKKFLGYAKKLVCVPIWSNKWIYYLQSPSFRCKKWGFFTKMQVVCSKSGVLFFISFILVVTLPNNHSRFPKCKLESQTIQTVYGTSVFQTKVTHKWWFTCM